MEMENKGPSSNSSVERQIRRDKPIQTDKSRRIRPHKCAKKTRKRDRSGDGKKGQRSKPKLCRTTLSSRSRRRAWKDECSGEGRVEMEREYPSDKSSVERQFP